MGRSSAGNSGESAGVDPDQMPGYVYIPASRRQGASHTNRHQIANPAYRSPASGKGDISTRSAHSSPSLHAAQSVEVEVDEYAVDTPGPPSADDGEDNLGQSTGFADDDSSRGPSPPDALTAMEELYHLTVQEKNRKINELEDLNSQYRQREKDYEARVVLLDNKVRHLTEENDELRARAIASSHDDDHGQRGGCQNEENEKALFELEEKLCYTTSLVEELRDKLDASEAEKKILRAGIESERRQTAKTIEGLQDKKNQLSGQLRRKDQVLAEVEEAKKNLALRCDDELSRLRDQLSTRNEQVSKMKLQLYDRNNKVKELEKVVEANQKKATSREEKVAQLSTILKSTQKQATADDSFEADVNDAGSVSLQPSTSSVGSGVDVSRASAASGTAPKSSIPAPHAPFPRSTAKRPGSAPVGTPGRLSTPGRVASRSRSPGTPSTLRRPSPSPSRPGADPMTTPRGRKTLDGETGIRARTPSRGRTNISFKDMGSVTIGLGTLALLNQNLASLDGMRVFEEMTTFYVQNNHLKDFRGLGQQPNLRELNAEHNKIHSFNGLRQQGKLEKVWLDGNPVCEYPSFRIMAILAVGPAIRKINGKVVSSQERRQAAAMGGEVAADVRRGLIIDVKCVLEGDSFVPVNKNQ